MIRKTILGIALIIIALGVIALGGLHYNPDVRVIAIGINGSLVNKPVPPDVKPTEVLVKKAAQVASKVASRFAGLKDFVFTEAENSAGADEEVRRDRGDGGRSGSVAKVPIALSVTEGPPASFVEKFGERSRQLWNELEKEPLENAERHSLGLFVDGTGKKGSLTTSSILAEASSSLGVVATGTRISDPSTKMKMLSWRLLEKCPATPPAGMMDLPPKLAGFWLRVYDEHKNMLKKSFVPVAKGDPFGCQLYQESLSAILPSQVPVDSFVGWVSVSAWTDQSTETGQPIWQNFSSPQSLSLEAGRGTGSVKIAWDPPVTRGHGRTTLDLKEIAYYRAYYGRESRKYTHVSEVHCSETSCLFNPKGLELGQWYLAITTVDTDGQDSPNYSDEITFVAK